MTNDSAISRSMADDWDDILSEIESLKQDMRRIVDAMTVTTSDLDQTWEALRKTQSDFGNLNKKVATLRALSPHTKKIRADRIAHVQARVMELPRRALMFRSETAPEAVSSCPAVSLRAPSA